MAQGQFQFGKGPGRWITTSSGNHVWIADADARPTGKALKDELRAKHAEARAARDEEYKAKHQARRKAAAEIKSLNHQERHELARRISREKSQGFKSKAHHERWKAEKHAELAKLQETWRERLAAGKALWSNRIKAMDARHAAERAAFREEMASAVAALKKGK